MNKKTHHSNYHIVKAEKSDKKDIKRFYKNQNYSASYIGQDKCYIVKIDNTIIAVAIISLGQEHGNYWLLHGLVTEKQHRGNKVASAIIDTIISEKNQNIEAQYNKIVSFADTELHAFYRANGFISFNSNKAINDLPLEFKQRLARYRENRPNLHCFLYSARDRIES